MRKIHELNNSDSCINSADDDEWVFVLKARDRHAPALVYLWALIRDLESTTNPDDAKPAKIDEAYACAEAMIRWRESRDDVRPTVSVMSVVLRINELFMFAKKITTLSEAFKLSLSADMSGLISDVRLEIARMRKLYPKQ